MEPTNRFPLTADKDYQNCLRSL